MEAMETKTFPLDLVLYIARYTSQSELSSLVVLNRDSYCSIVPTLYRNIRLNDVKSTLSFCNTINMERPLLGSYPKLIHIEPPSGSVREQLESLIIPISRMLTVVPNLRDLGLLVPEYVVESILAPPFAHSFMLTRLAIRIIAGRGFADFLNCQSRIEDFTCMETVASESDTRLIDTQAITNIDVGALSLLKRVSARSYVLPGLISGRPVSAVHLQDLCEPEWLEPVVEGLSRSSVPLVCLSLDLLVNGRNFEVDLKMTMAKLNPFRASLENLSLRLLCITAWGRVTKSEPVPGVELLQSSISPSYGLAKIRKSLSSFTALQNFEINSSLREGLPANLSLTIPELSQFNLWP